ncbi:MAG TPA: cytochrome c [Thermoanaerobaculia bacterium]|nr:cytochrome c [Thermoanaerobaculia bacterium]
MKVRSIILVLCVALAAVPALYAAPNGLDLYKARCAMCHGATGQADTPMAKKLGVKNLSSPDVQKQTDAQLTQTITKGKGKMPPFGTKLDADDVKALVGQIRTFAGK